MCLVVAGSAPDASIDALASYYSTLLGAPVGMLDPVVLTREAGGLPLVNARRSQVGIGAADATGPRRLPGAVG